MQGEKRRRRRRRGRRRRGRRRRRRKRRRRKRVGQRVEVSSENTGLNSVSSTVLSHLSNTLERVPTSVLQWTPAGLPQNQFQPIYLKTGSDPTEGPSPARWPSV
jgi:hypothetical protein